MSSPDKEEEPTGEMEIVVSLGELAGSHRERDVARRRKAETKEELAGEAGERDEGSPAEKEEDGSHRRRRSWPKTRRGDDRKRQCCVEEKTRFEDVDLSRGGYEHRKRMRLGLRRQDVFVRTMSKLQGRRSRGLTGGADLAGGKGGSRRRQGRIPSDDWSESAIA